ncbi:hypothetical protein BV25DRAFT_1922246 [Artomyces pyxidatus]|uniref:Uncharacterized protein n=1 Tax=Artomyces pyxidatus TaxID=48021 RepID=A0ACB8SFC4_9AGAM|nr:hypothetical protein BV25DRAFT_1922246 [Artomyces pyxidatus]
MKSQSRVTTVQLVLGSSSAVILPDRSGAVRAWITPSRLVLLECTPAMATDTHRAGCGTQLGCTEPSEHTLHSFTHLHHTPSVPWTSLHSPIPLQQVIKLASPGHDCPDVLSVRDSIILNGKSVSSEAYTHAWELVKQADADHRVGAASSVELLMATTLLIFEHAALEVVVLEVGMGGRLDATIVIADAYVLVSALMAVDLDHQAFL